MWQQRHHHSHILNLHCRSRVVHAASLLSCQWPNWLWVHSHIVDTLENDALSCHNTSTCLQTVQMMLPAVQFLDLASGIHVHSSACLNSLCISFLILHTLHQNDDCSTHSLHQLVSSCAGLDPVHVGLTIQTLRFCTWHGQCCQCAQMTTTVDMPALGTLSLCLDLSCRTNLSSLVQSV